jgi:hypothetical protein
MTSRGLPIACALLLLGTGACQTSKSSTPTAPTVAGPIPGVNITAPAMLEPAQGFKFKENEQPIRLVVQNATTNGARALSYTFEVASEAGFNTKVFSRSGVAPGDNNKTSVQIDRLEIGRAYYWRAWAEDGANTGEMATAGFEIYPKPAVNAPGAVSPINNELVANTAPALKISNAVFVGPIAGLSYEFQVATDQAFTKLVAGAWVKEGSGQTTYSPSGLPNASTLYWHARGSDGETTSTWSATQVFRTPAAPAPSPTPTPSPSGGGGGSCKSTSGPAIITCIAAKYASYRAPVGSLAQRQANMQFLRDRIIEAGLCGGNTYGWNLKRGGPDRSIDVIAWKRPDGNMGVDIGFDYDNIATELKLVWSEVDLNASYTPYTVSYSCSGV